MIYIFKNQYIYYHDLFCSVPASRLRGRHCHGWVRYIDTTQITVLMFVLYRLVFIQYSYYHDFFCLGTELRLCNFHRNVWVRYIDTTYITVWCISSMLLSIDLRWFCYFIIFYFKLTHGAMVKWWMVKWRNGKIKIRIGHFFLTNIESIHLFYFWAQMFCRRQINP